MDAQSKISKIESATDADLNFGDIIKYALALDQSIQLTFAPLRRNGVDHIRFHAECIKNQLSSLAKIAGNDKQIGDGVEEFAIETVQTLVANIESVLDRLPHGVQRESPPICVEAEGRGGHTLNLDAPKNARRVAKKPQST